MPEANSPSDSKNSTSAPSSDNIDSAVNDQTRAQPNGTDETFSSDSVLFWFTMSC